MASNDPEYMHQYYLRHRDEFLERSRVYRQTHPRESRAYHTEYQRKRRAICKETGEPIFKGWTPEYAMDQSLKWQYGISLAQFKTLNDAQGGKCAICGATPPFGRAKRLFVDHDHATGKVRGLLCRLCNSYLGRINDDPSRLIEYLNKFKDKKPNGAN